MHLKRETGNIKIVGVTNRYLCIISKDTMFLYEDGLNVGLEFWVVERRAIDYFILEVNRGSVRGWRRSRRQTVVDKFEGCAGFDDFDHMF